jgi:uroporphyrinogen-III synthase
MLSDSGADVDVIPVYRTSGANLSDQAAAQIPRAELVTFASAATVTAYVDACEELSVTGPQLCVSIGPTTTKAAVAAGFDVVAEASEPSVAGLVEAARLWAARDIVTAGGVA